MHCCSPATSLTLGSMPLLLRPGCARGRCLSPTPIRCWVRQYHGLCASNKYPGGPDGREGDDQALRSGDALWYAPDHDYGSHASVFVPYLTVGAGRHHHEDRHLARVKNTVTLPATTSAPGRATPCIWGPRSRTTRAVTTWRMPARANREKLKPPCARRRAVHVAAPPLQDPPQSGRSGYY